MLAIASSHYRFANPVVIAITAAGHLNSCHRPTGIPPRRRIVN